MTLQRLLQKAAYEKVRDEIRGMTFHWEEAEELKHRIDMCVDPSTRPPNYIYLSNFQLKNVKGETT